MLKGIKDSVKDFSEDLKSKVAEKEIDEGTLEPVLSDLRLKLLKNNVALETAEKIEERLESKLLGEKVRRDRVEEKVNNVFEQVLLDILDDSFDLEEELSKADEAPVVFLVGFNGSGKTTTTGKLAEYIDRSVVLGAGDTFRAASIEQLNEIGDELGVKVISHEYESDPAAVGYDTVEHAENEGKVALVDTAGRSHGDRNLMQELEKMVEVNQPDITFLVVDALSGNDVVEQAESYKGMFDAIIVTKLDIDDKGGVLVSISERSGKPVAFLGKGQKMNDLEEFNKEKFVENIWS